jgi:fatty-acyl-CoA synthase
MSTPPFMSQELHESCTLGELFVRAVRRYPERVALSDEREEISYSELGRRMAGFAAVMRDVGLRRGDGLAMISANRVDAVAAIAAAMMLGLRYTPLHPRGSLEDHHYLLEDSEAAALLIDEHNFREHGLALRQRTASLRFHFFLGECDASPSLRAAMREIEPLELANHGKPEDIAVLIYTGGTTGRPKGVVHRHRSLVTNLLIQLAHCELPVELRFLAVTPISHATFLFILPTLVRGGSFVMRKYFDPADFVETLHAQRITASFLVPTMINMILDEGSIWQRGPAGLETLVYGASPMAPARLTQAIKAFGRIFVQIFGQTEAPNVITTLSKQEHETDRPERLASCGHPTPGIDLRLLDDEGKEVPPGEIGEILVRGRLVMDSYWKRPEESAAALAGGWLRTGDLARRDENGFVYIVDRKKDLIISGGFNIYPREVEDVLLRHPDVSMCCVIGVPDARWGEAVTAVVVPATGARPDPDALISMVAAEKGGYCAPKSIDFVEAIPLTPLGKPDRKAVRSRYWQGMDRKVN